MKFKINKDHFAHGLATVLPAASSRAMPILNHVLIEAKNNLVTLTATNLDLGLRCQIQADVENPGTGTLPVRRLAALVPVLPVMEVTFETIGPVAKLTAGSATFQLTGIAPEEFPPLPKFEGKSHSLPQAELARLLRSVAYAQSTDSTRYILNGVYFNFKEGKLSLAATDGRRLATITASTSAPDRPPTHDGAFILPARAVAELIRLLGHGETVALTFNDRRVEFTLGVGGIYLYSKVIEGNYPNYAQIFPRETGHRVTLERELFRQAVHRVALICTDNSKSIRLDLSPHQLELTARGDGDTAHEVLVVTYAGPPCHTAFSPTSLLDPFCARTDLSLTLEIKDNVSVGVIKNEAGDFAYALMPVREF